MTITPASAISQRRLKHRVSAGGPFFAFVSPWLVGLVLLTLFPLCYSIYLSFTSNTGVDASNYVRAFTADPVLWSSIGTTLIYTVGSVVLGLATSLGLAVLIVRGLRTRALFQAIVFFPSVAAGVGVYLLWGWLLDSNVGPINYALSLVGISGPPWLTSADWALPTLILLSLFFYGTQTVVFAAGLKSIPPEYYEAARLDGAGPWGLFWNVTRPLLSPSTFFNVIISLIASLQLFAQPFLLTKGGPARSTYTMGMYIYDSAFKFGKFEYASALAWILFALTLLIAGVVIFSSRKWVHYDLA